MADKFADFLHSKKVGDIKPPAPLPSGLYRAEVTGWEVRTVQTKNGEGKILDVNFRITGPADDDLELDDDVTFPRSRAKGYWFNIDEETGNVSIDPAIRYLLEAVGVNDENLSLAESLEEAIGAQVIVQVEQEVDPKDPDRVFWNITRVMADK